MHRISTIALLPIVFLVSLVNSNLTGQAKDQWVLKTIQSQIPLSEKLKFEPTQEWIQNYFDSRTTLAEETAKLFRELGNPNYRKRREAQKKISQLPFIPQSLVEETLKTKNPEIKYFIKSIIKKRHDVERMYKHLTIWSIYQKQIKGFASHLLQLKTKDLESFQRFMIPVAIAATVIPGDEKLLTKILENRPAESDEVSVETLAAIWGLTVLEIKHAQGQLEAKHVNSSLQTKLARGLALLYCGREDGLKLLLPLLDCPEEEIRILTERAFRNTTGKWFGYVGSDDSKKRESAISGWTGFINQNTVEITQKFDPVTLRPELRLLGNTLIGFRSKDSEPGLFEISPTGQTVRSYGGYPCFWAQKLANGNVLTTTRIDGVSCIAEVMPAGKVVWTYNAGEILKCRPKPNGNILICFQSDEKIIEVNRDKKIVWGMRVGERVNDVAIRPDGLMFIGTDAGLIKVDQAGNEQNVFDAVDVSGIEILPDGDFLLASWKRGKVLKISQSGEKRWEFSVSKPIHAVRMLDGNYLVADGTYGFNIYNSKRKLLKRHSGFSARVFKR